MSANLYSIMLNTNRDYGELLQKNIMVDGGCPFPGIRVAPGEKSKAIFVVSYNKHQQNVRKNHNSYDSALFSFAL